MKSPFLWT